MPRLFNRLITFRVEGEIYDSDTTAEEILKNYNWKFKEYNDGKDICFLELEHNDHRGKITKLIKVGKTHKLKKPDTEFFLT
jgi:hypothetical protein